MGLRGFRILQVSVFGSGSFLEKGQVHAEG